MAAGPHQDFRRVRSPFQGELVRLRAPEDDDLPRLNEMFDDPDVLRFMEVAFPEPVAGTRAWADGVRRDQTSRLFAVETLAGELVGVCSLDHVDAASRTAVLGIWIGKPYWDRGYGTDAVRTVCGFAFDEMNLQRVGLGVYENNPRAKRAYEKVGFKEEGRLRRGHFVDGRYVDLIMMGLLSEEIIQA